MPTKGERKKEKYLSGSEKRNKIEENVSLFLFQEVSNNVGTTVQDERKLGNQGSDRVNAALAYMNLI